MFVVVWLGGCGYVFEVVSDCMLGGYVLIVECLWLLIVCPLI